MWEEFMKDMTGQFRAGFEEDITVWLDEHRAAAVII